MQNAASPCERFLELIRTEDLPDLGPAPRRGRLARAELERALGAFLRDTRPASALESPLRAAALLWHDYLDESHALSQGIESAEGSFLHGIMHRREPDYSNAKYWFRRVGDHPCFAAIARGLASLPLVAPGEAAAGRPATDWVGTLAPGGRWDAFAFVDACEAAAGGSREDGPARFLQAVQQVEFEALVRHILGEA